MADVGEIPPAGASATEPVEAASGLEIAGAGIAVGVIASIAGVAAAIAAAVFAFLVGEPIPTGSVAIIGNPHPELIKLVIPAGPITHIFTTGTLVQKRFPRPADQGAATLVAVLVGLAVIGYGYFRWA